MNQEGLATGTGYKRFSFRANVESKINKYLSIGMNLAPTYIVTEEIRPVMDLDKVLASKKASTSTAI